MNEAERRKRRQARIKSEGASRLAKITGSTVPTENSANTVATKSTTSDDSSTLKATESIKPQENGTSVGKYVTTIQDDDPPEYDPSMHTFASAFQAKNEKIPSDGGPMAMFEQIMQNTNPPSSSEKINSVHSAVNAQEIARKNRQNLIFRIANLASTSFLVFVFFFSSYKPQLSFFTLFVSIQIGLHAMELLFLPPSNAQSFGMLGSLLPPPLKKAIGVGSKYLALLGSFIDSLCIIVVVLGISTWLEVV